MRLLAAFCGAVLLMAGLGTAVQTQFVLAALEAVGARIAFADRLSMTLDDLAGFAPIYAAVAALGFLVAFLVAGAVARRLKPLRGLIYAVAGAAAIAAALFLMREVFFGVPPIAGARSLAGQVAQILCGALAGALFAWISAPAKESRS